MMKKARVLLSVFVSLIFAIYTASAVFAQDKKMEEIEIEKVVVTATRTEKDIMDVPTSMSVVDEKDIDRTGTNSTPELLRDIPGVFLFDNAAAGAKRVMIRGESGSRVLILIDGQKISEQKSMDGAPIFIAPEDIERIEVVKGPASVLYGSEAIGGVVNIITKKGGDKPVGLTLSGTYDSSTDGVAGYASVFGTFKGFSYRLSGNYSDNDDRKTPKGKLDNSAYEFKDGNLFLGYDWENISIGANYQRYESEIEVHTPADTISPPLTAFELDLPEWDREKYGVFFEARDISDFLVKTRADIYYQTTYKEFQNNMDLFIDPPGPQWIDTKLRITTKNDQDAYGGTLQLDWIPFEKHYLITGLDVVLDYLDADQRQFDTTTTAIPPGTTVTDDLFNDEANMKTYALYAQDEWNFINDFVLTAGLRHTWVDSELEETNDPSLTEGSSDDTNLTGSLGLVYSGIDNLALRTLYSQGYRYPNLLQLFIGTVHGSSDPTFANPDLDPETSDNFEVGVRFDNKDFLLDLAGFYSSADDYITTVAVTGGRQFDNVNEATTYGVEMLAQYTFESVEITPYINGTWIQRKFKTDAGSTRDTGLPDLNGRFGLRYEKNLEIVSALWGDLFVRAANDADEEDLSDGTVEHFDEWGTLNLALGVDLGKRSQYKLSLELNNLLDKEYTPATETLMAAERHVVVKLSATF